MEMGQGINFYDRGDVAAVDWDVAALTTDANWHDLDLSGIIPKGTKAVLLLTSIKGPNPEDVILFKTKGNVNWANCPGAAVQVANVNLFTTVILHPNANRLCEYYASNVVWTGLNLTVCGWWS